MNELIWITLAIALALAEFSILCLGILIFSHFCLSLTEYLCGILNKDEDDE